MTRATTAPATDSAADRSPGAPDPVYKDPASAQRADPDYALILAYDGTDFAGYARQSDPPQRTVQDEVERALATALRLPTESLAAVVAGRTDAGVHAAGQVVSFAAGALAQPGPLGSSQNAALLRSLNALTPADISVRDLRATPAGFSARFDAIAREYRYYIAATSSPPLFSRRYAWQVAGFASDPARRERLRRGAAALIGEHDFSSFAVAASLEGKNPVRTILSIDFADTRCFGEPLVEIRVVGTAFLHSMVRVIVGTLVALDAGRIAPGAVPGILEARTRAAAGPTAPARGLTLYGVTYPVFSSAPLSS